MDCVLPTLHNFKSILGSDGFKWLHQQGNEALALMRLQLMQGVQVMTFAFAGCVVLTIAFGIVGEL